MLLFAGWGIWDILSSVPFQTLHLDRVAPEYGAAHSGTDNGVQTRVVAIAPQNPVNFVHARVCPKTVCS